MLKKRIIPLICLIFVAVGIIAVFFIGSKQSNKKDISVEVSPTYNEYRLKMLSAEINDLLRSVKNGDSSYHRKYYKAANLKILADVEHIIAKKDHVRVYFHDLTDEKIEGFNKLFPYGCFKFSDVRNLVASPT